MLQNRLLSFSLIVSLSFLLLVSLAISSLIDAFMTRLTHHFHENTVVVFYILNNILTLIITTAIFAVIFKVLPDGTIKWKDIMWAPLLLLIFYGGKVCHIALYQQKQCGTTYGTAGSLVVLLLWIYFSSLILYFGAEITKAYAVAYGSNIYPKKYAVTTQTVEVNTKDQPVTN
jgi:membrane protein